MELTGTVRTFDPLVQDQIEVAIRQVIEGVGIASGTQISIDYNRYYPATINAEAAAKHALTVAATVGNAVEAPQPAFTSEDFAFMLQACEGAYIWLGQGKGGEHIPLHHPEFDFNDEIIATGVKLHTALVEDFLPQQGK